jgi:hypothetical protein
LSGLDLHPSGAGGGGIASLGCSGSCAMSSIGFDVGSIAKDGGSIADHYILKDLSSNFAVASMTLLSSLSLLLGASPN